MPAPRRLVARLVPLGVILIGGALACDAPPAPAVSVVETYEEPIDANQWMGRWYELGSEKRSGTSGQVNTTFDFRWADELSYQPARITVIRSAASQRTPGQAVETRGTIFAVDSMNTRFNLSYKGTNTAVPPGNYWIVEIDPDYSFAITSDRTGRWGTILGRSRDVDPAYYEALLQRAAARGVNTSRITRTTQIGDGSGG